MAMQRDAIDISNSPDLLQFIEELRRRNRAAVLRNGDEALAIVLPLRERARSTARRSLFKQHAQADVDAFLAAAGGWSDLVDTEQLKRDIAESRARSSRPPIEL